MRIRRLFQAWTMWVVLIGAGLCVNRDMRAQEGVPAGKVEEESLIQIPSFTPGQKHPLTPIEIISLRHPSDPQMSPDGKRIVFTVQQAFLEANKNRSALFLISADQEREPTKLLEETDISEVRWNPSGDFITYVSNKSGEPQVWRLWPETGHSEQVTRHVVGVTEYAWSPDGQQLAFLTKAPSNAKEERDAESRGIVYDDSAFNYWNVIDNSWFNMPAQVWVYDPHNRTETFLWQSQERSLSFVSMAGGLEWSPDGKALALTYQGASAPKGTFWAMRLGYVNLQSHEFKSLVRSNAINCAPTWSPQGDSVLFRSTYEGEEKIGSGLQGLSKVSADGKDSVALIPPGERVKQQWWLTDHVILIEKSDYTVTRLYEMSSEGGALRKIAQTEDDLHDCSLAKSRKLAACIRENTSTPPEIAVVDVQSGSVKTLTSLNPEYSNIQLGNVSLVRWHNHTINDGYGYLVKPLDYVKGRLYPLLIITYGVNDEFLTQPWPNYPVQVFAAKGYATLLINAPFVSVGYRGFHFGNAQEARVADYFGTGTEESVLNAIQMVVDAGVADPDKLGIMGVSGGSDLTDCMITRSDRFKAASSGDGSSFYGFLGYVIGGMTMQRHIEEIGAHSPYAVTSSDIAKEMSPALHAYRTKTPVLMEYQDRNSMGLEFYTALKSQGKPVELVFYPHDGHLLHGPKARLASMTRNLDWFNFWLKGDEDPDPSKADQYKRWRQLRKLREANQVEHPN
jgi:dipeptidyl aminopeptidase/acylaminoacyl peptidase